MAVKKPNFCSDNCNKYVPNPAKSVSQMVPRACLRYREPKDCRTGIVLGFSQAFEVALEGGVLSKHNVRKHGLASSMNISTRRFAAVLGALTLTLTLVFAGLLYRVGSISTPVVRSGGPQVVATQQGEATPQDATGLLEGSQEEGVELIDDEANPLAAAPGASATPAKKSPGFPVHLVLGFSLGFVVVFFISHIMRVNASISDMNRKTH